MDKLVAHISISTIRSFVIILFSYIGTCFFFFFFLEKKENYDDISLMLSIFVNDSFWEGALLHSKSIKHDKFYLNNV